VAPTSETVTSEAVRIFLNMMSALFGVAPAAPF